MDDTNTPKLRTQREQVIERLYGTVLTKSQLLHHQLEVCKQSFFLSFIRQSDHCQPSILPY
jgi:hypothetical protein